MDEILFADRVSFMNRNLIYQLHYISVMQSATAILKTFCRSAMTIILNGGTPMSLIERISELSSININVSGYETVGINFKDDLCNENIEKILDDPIYYLKEQVFVNSNERTWRSLFWDPVIMKLFRSSTGLPEPVNYHLISDWKSSTLFPDKATTRLDLVSLFKLDDLNIPILIIEHCSPNKFKKSEFPMKLYSMMIMLCNKMARELEERGKKAESARVYGLWISGSQVQMIVAHPMIHKIDDCDSEHEIDIILTTHDHWRLDVLKIDNFSECKDTCCKHSGKIESIIKPVTMRTTSMDVPLSIPAQYAQCDSPIILDEPETETKTSLETDIVKAYSNEINFAALNKLNLFIILVKRRIALLASSKSSIVNLESKRKFISHSSIPVSSSVHSSEEQKSPILNSKTNNSKSKKKSTKTFTIIKSSKKELDILYKLALYPLFFPKMYNVQHLENNLMKLRFEKMIPLVNWDTGLLYFNFQHKDKNMYKAFVEALTFAIHGLHGLYILHNVVGIVHGDISPNNILFSTLYNVWKLNDFDRSLSIEESERTQRTSGTQGYKAPESIKTSIFTRKSDIYSFGRILTNFFYFPLLPIFMEYELYDSHQTGFNLFLKFEKLVNGMTAVNPENRPSIEHLLRDLYGILRNFNYYKMDSVLLSVKSMVQSFKNE